MKIFVIFSFILTFSVYASYEDDLKTEREKLNKSKEENLKRESQNLTNLNTAEAEYLKASNEFNHLEELAKNFTSSKIKIADELKKSLDDLSGLNRAFSKKGGFYKCLQDQIAATEALSSGRCKTLYFGKFTQEELERIQRWENFLPLNLIEISSKQKKIKKEMEFTQSKIVWAKKSLIQIEARAQSLLNEEKLIKLKELDQEILDNNKKFITCNDKTPAISLEEKIPFEGAQFQGPFYEVPRDNQDGLGTCYANTAKNLLVGASMGKANASFLDLALLYKDESGKIAKDGLNAGFSCLVLKGVSQKGYCPQEFAPFERGEKNLYTEGLMPNSQGSVEDTAYLVKMVSDFLQADENLKAKNSELSRMTQEKGKWIIDKVKSDPHIKLPFPVARFEIPSLSDLKDAYYASVESNFNSSEETFLNDYNSAYAIFLPKFIQAVNEGKRADQIFNLFRSQMSGFIQKYQLQGKLNHWKRQFIEQSMEDFKDPNLKKSVQASSSFIDELRGADKIECESDYGELFEFINNLKLILEYLKINKLDSSKLLNGDEKFKSPSELMQLIVAPSCLAPENRKKINFNLHCEDGHEFIQNLKSTKKDRQEKESLFHSRIVASLLQGYPLGNTFNRHINTIVGMRFNEETKTCELKIRESQTGNSSWQPESDIFDKIEALTEVRRN